jgi:hypothetical protein
MAKRKRDSAQPQMAKRKRDSAQPQVAKRKRDSVQPQMAKRKRDSAQPQMAKRKRDSAQPQIMTTPFHCILDRAVVGTLLPLSLKLAESQLQAFCIRAGKQSKIDRRVGEVDGKLPRYFRPPSAFN